MKAEVIYKAYDWDPRIPFGLKIPPLIADTMALPRHLLY